MEFYIESQSIGIKEKLILIDEIASRDSNIVLIDDIVSINEEAEPGSETGLKVRIKSGNVTLDEEKIIIEV